MDNNYGLNNCVLVASTSIILGLGVLGCYHNNRAIESTRNERSVKYNLEAILVAEPRIIKCDYAKNIRPNGSDPQNYRR